MDVSRDSDESNSRRSTTPEPARKKKKIDPAQQMQTLYDFMRRYRREDGSELCDTFIRAPKRRSDPAYYDVVSDPIDMLRIQQKLKMDEYANMSELKEDFERLFSNAWAYYKKGSSENKDATELSELFTKALAKVEAGEDPSATLGDREESEEGELNEMLEDLFGAVMTATDTQDSTRPINLVFRLLPSQKRYAEYYKVIKEPIDLKMIATKICDNKYTSLAEMEDDILLMCKNAQIFNEPGSQIYRDTRLIVKTVKSKKYELEVNKVARENRGSRTTRRLQPNKRHFAAEIASLPYEDSESEESSEGEDIDLDDPLWSLYSAVRHHKTQSGNPVAEPFLQLPSKRELPDYYVAIPNPLSLNMIRKKLKNNEYNNEISNLFEDLDVMFENCKTYNRPDSRLFKDACKLQRIMKNKLDDLEDDEEDDDDDENDDDEDDEDQEAAVQDNEQLKKMRVLYNTMLRYRNPEGIQIIGMFMEKPSKKDYPDYYEVIVTPMDMKTINERIKSAHYKNIDDFMSDARLMFTNCRQYNEEGSAIVADANTLERQLLNKARTMGILSTSSQVGQGKGGLKKSSSKTKNLSDKLKKLVDTVREFKDPKGRQLSLIFLKLPNQKEFPDYYEVIKKPVDFEKIGSKLRAGLYVSMDECLADFVLMFDNACKYNEPDSQIYKDALTLQNLVHKTCKTLAQQDQDESSVPNVNDAVQEILSYMFIEMYNQQDTEERCFSDSMAELPEYNEVDGGKQVRALNLDLIKRRLDRGLYKRLDLFQRDMFAVLERARNLSRSDSQIFEDSVELQTRFIRIRDEACGHGEILQSRALLYTQSDLLKSVEALRSEKQQVEQPEEGGEDEEGGDQTEGEDAKTNTATFNQQEYHVGEFVYTENTERGQEAPYIFLIENIFTNKEGEQMIHGNQFFRPIETFHVPTRKFLENEVFRTDVHKNVSFAQIEGRCYVMSVKDYFKDRPDGFEDKDVYVCESRYNSKARSFKKMKLFWPTPDHIQMVTREKVIEPKRIMSVFKERIERHKEEIEELEILQSTVEEEVPPNIVWENNEAAQEGCTYYEQYTIPGPITLRRGDAVYVRAENGKNLIAQIDTMWTAADGMAYFHGPWFVTPKETPHQPTQMFFPRETFISTIQDTNPLLSVVGRCCIQEMEDFVKSRPTQYSEDDVCLCESVYDESRRVIRSLPPTGLKRYEYNSTSVVADEVYYFKNPIKPQKEPSPLLQVTSSTVVTPSVMDVDNEDSLGAPPSVCSTDSPVPSTPANKKVKTGAKKPVTPYILFASEIRRSVTVQNKECSFGEISRIVGDKWRQLSDSEKQIYEERAKKLNEDNAIKFAEEKKLQAEEERRRLEQQQTLANAARTNGIMNGHLVQSGLTMVPLGTPNSVPRGINMSPLPQQMSRPSSQNAAPMKQVEPIFHTVPPRPQRLLHSEAYIKYIEGLTTESNTMSNWERQLTASKENTRVGDEARLPAHWLADNGDHGTSLDALWALRDFLMCDSLGVTKIVQGPL